MNAYNGYIIFKLCALSFRYHNLSKCSNNVKENAYFTIIRPLLEYTACVWDSYREYLIYDIKKIQ